MPAVATVSYPRTADSTFNLDYYLKHHLPMVQERWAKYGMKDWFVCKFDEGQYSVVTTSHWNDMSGFQKAIAEDSKAIIDDLSNYSNQPPVSAVGEIVGQS